MRVPKPPKTPELAAAESAVLAALAAREFVRAAKVVADYEARQPISRGIGIDWSNYNTSSAAAGLRAMFESDRDDRESVKLAAGMVFLWGTGKPRRRWLSASEQADDTARALVFLGYEAQQAENDRSARERFGYHR